MPFCEQHQTKIQNNKERLDSQSEKLDKIDGCLTRLTAIVEHQEQTENDHEGRIRTLELKDGKMHDNIVSIVFRCLLGGLIGFLLCYIGIK